MKYKTAHSKFCVVLQDKLNSLRENILIAFKDELESTPEGTIVFEIPVLVDKDQQDYVLRIVADEETNDGFVFETKHGIVLESHELSADELLLILTAVGE